MLLSAVAARAVLSRKLAPDRRRSHCGVARRWLPARCDVILHRNAERMTAHLDRTRWERPAGATRPLFPAATRRLGRRSATTTTSGTRHARGHGQESTPKLTFDCFASASIAVLAPRSLLCPPPPPPQPLHVARGAVDAAAISSLSPLCTRNQHSTQRRSHNTWQP